MLCLGLVGSVRSGLSSAGGFLVEEKRGEELARGVEAHLDPGDTPADEGPLRFCLALWAHKKPFPGAAEGLSHALKGRPVGRTASSLGPERVRGVYISWRSPAGDS